MLYGLCRQREVKMLCEAGTLVSVCMCYLCYIFRLCCVDVMVSDKSCESNVSQWMYLCPMRHTFPPCFIS